MNITSDNNIKAAEHLLDAFELFSYDEDRYDRLLQLIKDILKPYIDERDPKAIWLKACLPNLGEETQLSDQEFNDMWLSLIKEASDGNCTEAQFRYGSFLYEQQAYEEALVLYKKSALQGYAPAQWCYGIDKFNGVGIDKDEIRGLYFIELSAKQNYEYAVDFIAKYKAYKLEN